MAKYKVGDKVRIVNYRSDRMTLSGKMDKWLGKTMTIREYFLHGYRMLEDYGENLGNGWYWGDDMISGLAEPERESYTVELRFDGAITTATLKRGGRDVKTAEARCNPKDTYSRAEGARVAVERLFEKKCKEDKPKESKPKIGDKFVVVSLPGYQVSRTGEIVTLWDITGCVKLYKASDGALLIINDCNVKPYKETSK